MSIWRWHELIDPVPPGFRISLGEGQTPLIRSRRIGPEAGLRNLFFKLESANPCGSFKDRFGAGAISHMLAEGQTECIATSSGNTGAALAAYCAAAGIRCRIAIVETAPLGKMKQMLAYGAEVFRVKGFGLDPEISAETFSTLQEIGSRPGHAIQVSSYIYSPKGMAGCETLSFDLNAEMDSPIDHVFCPAGGGGLCVSVARGFATLVREGHIENSPAIECVQPEGNDTMAGPLRDGLERAREVSCTTEISGLQVANVNDGHLVIEECRPTGGTGHLVPDDAIWNVQKRLAREEGIFCEPAGAVALTGALQAVQKGDISRDATIVCLVTGIGFKDDASVERMVAGTDCPMLELSDLKAETNC